MGSPILDALLGNRGDPEREAEQSALEEALLRGDRETAERIYSASAERQFLQATRERPEDPPPIRPEPAVPPVRPEVGAKIEAAWQRNRQPGESLTAYVDRQARLMETGGAEGKARLLRDYAAQRQAGEAPKRQLEAAKAHEAAAQEALRGGARGIGFQRAGPQLGRRPEEALEVAQAEVASAERGAPPPTLETVPTVSLERQRDLLEAAGVPVEGLTAGDVATHFGRQFGQQIQSEQAADAAASHLWRQRARALADKHEVSYLDFPTTEAARSYVKAQEATVYAQDLADAQEQELLHKGLAAASAIVRNVTFGIWNPEERLPEEQRREHDLALQELAKDAPWMPAALEGGALALTLPVFGAVHRTFQAGLQAAKVPKALAQVAAEGLTLGAYSALSAREDPDQPGSERIEAGLHGLGMGLLAGPFAALTRQGLQKMPGPLANGFASGMGFLGAEFVLSGGNLEDQQALESFILGFGLGAGHGQTPEQAARAARLDAARAVVLEGVHRAGMLKVNPENGQPMIDWQGRVIPLGPAGPRTGKGRAPVTDFVPDRPERTLTPEEVAAAPRPGARAVVEAEQAAYAEALADPRAARERARAPEQPDRASRARAVTTPEPGAQVPPRRGPAQGEPGEPVSEVARNDARRWVQDLPEGTMVETPEGRLRVRKVQGGEVVERLQEDGTWRALDRQGTFGGDPEALKDFTVDALARGEVVDPPATLPEGMRKMPQRLPRGPLVPPPPGEGVGSVAGQPGPSLPSVEPPRPEVRDIEPREFQRGDRRKLGRFLGFLDLGGRPISLFQRSGSKEIVGIGVEEGRIVQELSRTLGPGEIQAVGTTPGGAGRGKVSRFRLREDAQAAAPTAAPSTPRRVLGRTPKQEARHTPENRRRILRAAAQRQRIQRGEAERRELESARFTDTRTGLRNQDAWEAMRRRWPKDAEGHPTPPEGSLFWQADLGNFKEANEALGHEKADILLGKVGEKIRAVAAKLGIEPRELFRTGGDEFAVASDKAEAFAREIARDPWVEHEGVRVAIDGGVGATPREADAAAARTKAARKEAAGIGRRGSGTARTSVTPAGEATTPTTPPTADAAPAVAGRPTTIPTRKGKVEAEYALVESDRVIQSHDPANDFAWNPAYQPRELQERDYATRIRERDKVQRFSGAAFDPAEVANTAPRATDGPPTIAANGIVLNGNGRVMVLKSLSPEQKARYRAYLEENAAHFGLTPEQVRAMRDPILVRRTALDPASREAFEFARTGQEGTTESLRPVDYAARHVAMVRDVVWDAIRTGEGESMGEVLNQKGAEFRRALHDALPHSERARFFNDDLTFTDAGKELGEAMVTLRAFSEPSNPASVIRAAEFLESMPPQFQRTLAAAAPQIFDLGRQSFGRPQIEALMDAAWYWQRVQGGEEPAAWFKSAETGLTPIPPIDPLARAWMDFIYTQRASPRKFRDALKALAKLEDVTHAEEKGLFRGQTEATDPLDRLNRVLDGWRPQAGEAVVIDHKGGLLFGSPGEAPREVLEGFPHLASPERVNEAPAGMALPARMEAPSAGNGYAMDLPPLTKGPTAEWKGKRVGPHELIRAMEKAILGIPIRTGGMTARERKRAAGYFKVMPEVIRLRQANDLPTAIHEVGHAIEKLVWWNLHGDRDFLENQGGRFTAELERLGRMLYGSKIPAAGYVREGFAEFLRGWAFGTPKVEQLAPTISKWWHDSFLKEYPSFAKRLNRVRDLAQQYLAQGTVNRALATIKGRAPDGGRVDRAVSRLRRLKTRWVEAGDILADMSDVAALRLFARLPFSQDPFAMLTGLRLTHTARARYMVQTGMIGPEGATRGAALQDAVDIVTEHGRAQGWRKQQTRDAFTLYLVGRRAIERITTGKGNPGISLATARELVRTYDSPEFQRAASMVYAWNRGLLEYAVLGGALPAAEAQRILKGSTDFVPLQRALDGIPEESLRAALRAVQGGRPLRHFRGSGERLRDPFDAMIENAEKMVRWTHERMVANAVVSLAQVEGMGRYIEEIPHARVPKTVPLERIRRQLEKAGADLSGADPDAIIAFFEPAMHPTGSRPIISHRAPGASQTRWYQVDPRLYEAMHSLDIARLPKALDLTFGAAARALRLGTTGLRAAFSLGTNPVRDMATSYLQSTTRDNPFKFAAEYARSWGNEAARLFGKQNPYSDLFERLGGQMAQPLGVDTRQTRRATRELFAGKGWKGRVVRVVRSPIEHFRDFLQFPESAARVGELRRMAQAVGWKPGGPITLDQSLAMLIASKRVSVDFSAAGTWARTVNQLVPFFNASLQGTRSFARAFRNDPVRATLKGLTRTLLGLGLWAANKDEEWYRDMPWRERFSYFWIEVGDELIAIPRAFDWDNIFATLPEAILDAISTKDPRAGQEWAKHIVETTALDYLTPTGILGANPLAGTTAELLANEDFFTGKSIVPESQRRRPAREQVAPYTSGIARFLGDTLGWSPRKVDHAIRGLTGSAVHDLLGVADVATGTRLGLGSRKSRGTFKDVPVVGQAFGRRGGKEGIGSVAVEDLFDALRAARELQESTEHRETPRERLRRLALQDAATAIKWLRQLQGEAETLREQQAIQREIRSIAQRALAAPPGARFTGPAEQAERRARAVASPPGAPRRILRPAQPR